MISIQYVWEPFHTNLAPEFNILIFLGTLKNVCQKSGPWPVYLKSIIIVVGKASNNNTLKASHEKVNSNKCSCTVKA